MASFSLEYVSVGCNQTPCSADWNANDVLAYGAGSSIALAKKGEADVVLEKIVCMLHGHTDRVNCVQWILSDNVSLLVSGAVDKKVIIWKCVDLSNLKYEVNEILPGHSAPVICVAGINQNSTTTIVSGSSDSTLKMWERNNSSMENNFRLLQTVSFGSGFVLGVNFHCFDGHLILACGTDLGNVEIYTKQSDQFIKVVSLVGHEDWVRDVHFTQEDDCCLLASCSQDSSIRLWKLFRGNVVQSEQDDLRVTENSFVMLNEDGVEKKYMITLESVLIGHDEWVYSVRWQPRHGSEPPCLLSASMDKTMVLWILDSESGLWIEQVRVGDVGGNSLGLYGAVFGPDGNYILAHGYQGAFHLWKKITLDHWQPITTISGHYDHVQDITWEPKGEFLVSVSVDQTTRIHAPWVQKGSEITWREIARPQIHGYNMHCLCMLSSFLFVSGADEKVLRVFHSSKKFVDNLLSISNVDLKLDHRDFPSNASVPSLGLSNKAGFKLESPITLSAVSTVDQASTELTEAPFEGQLQNTLWPEIHKLYGHSYEIFCVANSPDGMFVASACMASKQEYASILIWDTSQWRQVQTLCHHTLTVTQLAFSHSSELLLAVSRDRTWSLWRQREGLFFLESKLDKHIHPHVHSRIIWSCSWTHDDAYFATGSRDKKVVLWSLSNTGEHYDVISLQGALFSDSVTAVDFAPFEYKSRYLLAVGLESGAIYVYNCCKDHNGILECHLKFSVDTMLCHTAAVKRLKWRPSNHVISLASCSLDHCIKIFNLISNET